MRFLYISRLAHPDIAIILARSYFNAHCTRGAGRARIAAPPGIAYEVVAPLAAKIRRQYPGMQIEVLSAIETLHLGRGEADLSLRSQKPADADLVWMDETSSAMRVYDSKA